jgi:hypothetical protein
MLHVYSHRQNLGLKKSMKVEDGIFGKRKDSIGGKENRQKRVLERGK